MAEEEDLEQKALRERMVALTHKAFDEADQILKSGSPARKDALIRSLLGNVSHQLKKPSSEDNSAMRLALEQLMAQNRVQGEGENISAYTPDSNGTQINPSPPKPNHPDQGPALQAPGFD